MITRNALRQLLPWSRPCSLVDEKEQLNAMQPYRPKQKPQKTADAMAEIKIRRRSTLEVRNITVAGRRTSIRLERPMWDALNDIAGRERLNLHQLCSLIDEYRHESTLTAAVRVFVMAYYKAAATENGFPLASQWMRAQWPAGAIGSLASRYG
jgi:predicted DNA-binding ribbon-helix-helix protein